MRLHIFTYISIDWTRFLALDSFLSTGFSLGLRLRDPIHYGNTVTTLRLEVAEIRRSQKARRYVIANPIIVLSWHLALSLAATTLSLLLLREVKL